MIEPTGSSSLALCELAGSQLPAVAAARSCSASGATLPLQAEQPPACSSPPRHSDVSSHLLVIVHARLRITVFWIMVDVGGVAFEVPRPLAMMRSRVPRRVQILVGW
jgi:hypothetical protein